MRNVVSATHHIRKLRGSSKPHLIEADDGGFYVVKLHNTPQSRRSIVNECLASAILHHLQLPAAASVIVQMTPEFLLNNPDLCTQKGSDRVAAETGWHFGSRCPGDPNKVALYDFLPDVLLGRVINREEFYGMLAFDKWVANVDSRQCVFLRAQSRQVCADSPLPTGFAGVMIDHGFAFNGPHWNFPDSPSAGLYFRKSIYSGIHSLDDFEPWLSRIVGFSEGVLQAIFASVPDQWLDSGDRELLDNLRLQLMHRRSELSIIVKSCIATQPTIFPAFQICNAL